MCEPVLARLAAGEPLSAADRAHLERCPRCAALVAATAARPALAAPPRIEAPTPGGLRARARRRSAGRAGALALAAAALIGVALSSRGPAPEPAPEPDILALLDEVDAMTERDPSELPGTEALTLLDPMGDLGAETFDDENFFY